MPRTTAAANAAPMPQRRIPDDAASAMANMDGAIDTIADLSHLLYLAAGELGPDDQGAMRELSYALTDNIQRLGKLYVAAGGERGRLSHG